MTCVQVLKEDGQVATTDDVGVLIIWTVLLDQSEADVDLGLAHWGMVRMVASEEVNLPVHFALSAGPISTYCMGTDTHSVFVGTDAGHVLNYALKSKGHSR